MQAANVSPNKISAAAGDSVQGFHGSILHYERKSGAVQGSEPTASDPLRDQAAQHAQDNSAASVPPASLPLSPLAAAEGEADSLRRRHNAAQVGTIKRGPGPQGRMEALTSLNEACQAQLRTGAHHQQAHTRVSAMCRRGGQTLGTQAPMTPTTCGHPLPWGCLRQRPALPMEAPPDPLWWVL